MRSGIRRFLFFSFTWQWERHLLCHIFKCHSSSNVRGKTDFSREHYHFSWRGLHRRCADYRFEPPARQVIKSQDPAALLPGFCLHFVFLIPLSEREEERSSGGKTPLTKVNSHGQSFFAGVKSTDKNFIHELLPRIATRFHDKFQRFEFLEFL